MRLLADAAAPDDEDGAARAVRDALAHAAERTDAVETAAADDEQVGAGRGLEERVEWLRIDERQLREVATERLLVDVSTRSRRDRRQLRAEPLGEVGGGDVRGRGVVGAVDADDDGAGERRRV